MRNNSKTHRFNLVENALDSLEHAIAHLNNPSGVSKGDYKRVILDLSHVAELLLKERLRKVHPAFVLSNIDKYRSKNAHTVGAEEAQQRLQKIDDVEFMDKDQAALKTIRDKRNEIEHYEFSISENEARIVIGNVLVFIFRFSNDELGLDWADRRINDPAWKKLNEFAEFYETQLKHIMSILSDSAIPICKCPICQNKTFDLESEICIMCGHRDRVLNCILCESTYLFSEVDYGEAGLCPKCEWDDGYSLANFEKY